MVRLRASDYKHHKRKDIQEDRLRTYKSLKTEQEEERPVHRPDSYQEKERRINKALNKNNWFRKGGANTV
jgi:hypothetical protein